MDSITYLKHNTSLFNRFDCVSTIYLFLSY